MEGEKEHRIHWNSVLWENKVLARGAHADIHKEMQMHTPILNATNYEEMDLEIERDKRIFC
jgi:hypothetical protein